VGERVGEWESGREWEGESGRELRKGRKKSGKLIGFMTYSENLLLQIRIFLFIR
jgi:hypothetical protein